MIDKRSKGEILNKSKLFGSSKGKIGLIGDIYEAQSTMNGDLRVSITKRERNKTPSSPATTIIGQLKRIDTVGGDFMLVLLLSRRMA